MANTPVAYDAAVIQEFAQRLYRQATSIILTSTLLGLFGGVIAGAIGAALAQARPAMGVAMLVGAIVGGLWGCSRGKERAFKLKLEAQMALCQVQIERSIGRKSRSLLRESEAEVT